MAFWGQIKGLLNGSQDEDYEEEYDIPEEEDFEENRARSRARYDGYDDYDEEENFVETRPRQNVSSNSSNKVVSIHTTAQLQVVIFKPTRFEDVVEIADHLLERRTVIVNLEQSSKEINHRIVDFLCGSAYVLNGQLKKIANNTYIVTPYNVGLIGADLIDELESNGVFF